MLVGTDGCVRVVFLWEETEVPGGNPQARLGDHMTNSHVPNMYQTRVAAVRSERFTTAPVGKESSQIKLMLIDSCTYGLSC